MQYPIAIYKDPNGYTAIIPDIPTLTATGSDMAEVIAIARHVVLNHLLALIQEDLPLPEPSAVSERVNESKFAGYIWAVVHIELSRLIGDSIELTIRLPAKVITHVHQHFPDDNINQVILDALKQYLSPTPALNTPAI